MRMEECSMKLVEVRKSGLPSAAAFEFKKAVGACHCEDAVPEAAGGLATRGGTDNWAEEREDFAVGTRKMDDGSADLGADRVQTSVVTDAQSSTSGAAAPTEVSRLVQLWRQVPTCART